MKNKLIFGMIAGAVLAIGFVLSGCDNGGGGGGPGIENTDPKTIAIEGISAYTGNGCIRVFSDLNNVVNNQPVNAGIGYAAISNGKLTIELSVPTNNTVSSQTKWTGNGSYYIYFMPQVNNSYSTANGMIYVGSGQSPKKYNINEAVITVSYSEFKKYNVWK
ncbi:MAG: hypothetical protein LBP76_07145 [Treponema sp.]|jgi:hypothetical protein|nr:hypothetical protein [Treponema sp.]